MNRVGIKGRTVDLYVRFFDATGNLINADATPKVEIYDSNGTRRQASSSMGISLSDNPGLYKLTYNIPENTPDGYWTDLWTAKIGDDAVTNGFSFLVTSSGTIEEAAPIEYDPGDDVPWNFTLQEEHGVNILLKMVKCRVKNDGVRKVPDGQGGYTEVPCSVFTNDELICFLVNSLSEFNMYPHFTGFTFADPQIYTIFAEIVVQGAILLALAAQSLIEKGREFSLNDNGVIYQPPQIAEILNTQYNEQLADYKEKLKMIKNSIKPSPRGLGTFRVTSIAPAFLRLRHLRERQII